MRPILIYFRETHLDENNKFTLYFSDHEIVQEIEFLSKSKYYITNLNCKSKLKEYIHEDEKIKNYLQKVDFYSKKVLHTYVILII